MTDTDTSRERLERLQSMGCADYLHMALLARAEKAEAALVAAYRLGIDAATDCIGHITRTEDFDAIRALPTPDAADLMARIALTTEGKDNE